MTKLDPKVGDRVILVVDKITRAGKVVGMGEQQVGPDEFHPMVEVDIDGFGTGWFYAHDLEVRDRKTAEWPEGWERYSGGAYPEFTKEIAFTLAECRKLLADLPYIVEHWRELMGGEDER